MLRRSSRTPARNSQVLVTSALALALTALPIGIHASDPGLQWQTVIAGNGDGGGGNGQGGGHGNGNGGGNGGGSGGGNGHGNAGERGGPRRDHAHGQHDDRGGPQGRAQGYHDVDELMDSVRSGKALGLERRDERIDRARERYAGARGKAEPARHGLQKTDEAGPAAHRLSPEETKALMARGWRGPAAAAGGFRNHGERVRTMVELSKRLGYGARVGALQANFGTPQENRITALQAELAQARAAGDQAEVARLESALAEAIAKAKPGNGPDDSWATADLDVNEDGVVDRRDLEALEQDQAAGAPAAS